MRAAARGNSSPAGNSAGSPCHIQMISLPEAKPYSMLIHVQIVRYDAQRTLLLHSHGQERIVTFTPLEYQLLLALLEADGRCVPDHILLERIYASTQVARRTFEKHIENLRKKLYPSGLEVCRVQRYGYLLCDSFTRSSRPTQETGFEGEQ